MSRSGESVTRLDIRFPNEMYDQMQQIAIKDGARTHHISQKVEVSPTVIKLVQLGLDALNGKLPDTSDNMPDSLPDKSSNILSDKNNSVSDISDKRIESIVDRRLTELGLFPDCQTENNSTSHLLPDKINTISDMLPDRDSIVSDKTTFLPDSLSDTENIPSADSSNSESLVEDVQVIRKTDSYTYSEFHKWVGISPSTPNKANGDIAITIAKDKGLGDWRMNSKSRKFTKLIQE